MPFPELSALPQRERWRAAAAPSRRGMLAGLLAAALLPVGGAEAAAGAGAPGAWLGTRVTPEGEALLAVFDQAGATLFEAPLPARGHGAALHPDGRLAVLLARRPGDYALVLTSGGGVVGRLAPGPGRCFCGHGAFAFGGRLFVATEQEREGDAGWLGLYDAAAGLAPLGALPTGGLDPHELLVLADGRTAVVANGGLSSDPALPGRVLNLEELDSSLAVLDLRDGRLLAQARLPRSLRLLSLRHLAPLAGGRVAVGLQHQGAAEEPVPLVALFEGGALRPLALPGDAFGLLRGYVGSIASDPAGRRVAVTSPRGGAALLLDPDEGALLAVARLPDVCGLATAAEGFVLASGLAGLHRLAEGPLRPLPAADPAGAWDNHLLALGGAWTAHSLESMRLRTRG